jgi:conjugative relaxase-like TrwC/TraI family protein
MLTIRCMRNGAGYARKHLENNDYWAEGEKVCGQWFGRGAEKLGLKGQVELEQFERLRQGCHPQTGQQIRQRISRVEQGEKSSRNLYDFTLSAPKSISLMAILANDSRLTEAHDRAVMRTLEQIEKYAATRVRADGRNEDRITGNLAVACYRHDTSRRLDPQLHTHCVAANLTWDQEEQRWKALQAGGIYERCAFFTEFYRNILAQEVHALGYETESRLNGFEIKGVPERLLKEFSRGSEAREAAVAEFIKEYGREPTDNEISVLVRDSRPDKLIHISTAEVRRQQFDRMTAEDWRTLAQVREAADLRSKKPVKTISAEAALQHGLDHVFERLSVAPDHAVYAAALRYGRGQVNLNDLERAMREREARAEIIRAGTDIATRASLDREREMVHRVREGRNRHERMGKEPKEFDTSKLNAEQKRVVDTVLDSPDFAITVQGAAGTGKTQMLRALARGMQAGGRLMTAIAPTTKATDGLKKTGFQNAMTVEALLQNKEAHPLLSGRAIVVDEAGMVSGRQLSEIIRLAGRYDARLILVGDTKQLGAVEASDALRILIDEKSIASVSLRKVQRQESKEYRDAIRALRINPLNGFHRLETMKAINEVDLFERPEKVAEAYLNAKGSALVVCPTHEEIRRVTDAIRAGLIQEQKLGEQTTLHRLEPQNWTEAQKRHVKNFEPGQVLVFHKGTKDAHKYEAFTVLSRDGESITARSAPGRDVTLTKKQAKCFSVFAKKEIDVAPGDWLSIQANLNDGPYKFTNGERVKVASINEEGSIVLDDKRTIPRHFRQFTHGYAITAHRAQGTSVDEVIISGDRMNKELFYVAASRGRKKITVFTEDAEELRRSIGVSGQRMSALELLRTVDRSRTAERPRSTAAVIGDLLYKVWENIPRLVFGEQFAPRHEETPRPHQQPQREGMRMGR